ncbi:MAG: roadblock/LC7 domain-containing protein [Methanocellales archaeon]|nr:roadblock/LC7 domain-containing protein [Methanocellales archaeon]
MPKLELNEMMTKGEMLERVLNDLKRVGGIEASAVVSRDGLLMASDFSWHLT